MVRQFPLGIRDFAEVFETMHELRETADYNPEALFSVDEVWYWSKVVYSVIESFEATPPQHRRAFTAYLLLPQQIVETTVFGYGLADSASSMEGVRMAAIAIAVAAFHGF